MAQAMASTTRKVVATFGSGGLQGWRQMYYIVCTLVYLSSFSHVAIDPDISVEG